ncbi:alpha/beta-hydrolase [Apiospora saccharicola]|uniref:Alpha/beta-hydrolase n=1 Tax=Apiospora saccharicola TaxID=335842 RepID=A0ABR1U773_9PEZI
MALRTNLTAPFVVSPLVDHTHTVIFLHRLPATADDKALRAKVLSSKQTKDGKTLRLQFPTVRWVFPHAKLHNNSDKYWSDLTPEDCTAAGLELGHGRPYISQLILQEAQRAGGLDKVVLGGQGETALAAHDALDRLRQTMEGYTATSIMQAFVEAQMDAHMPGLQPWKLAGYVGMHPDNDQTTRDQRDFWLVSKFSGGEGGDEQKPAAARTVKNNINNSIIRNTPHEFIRGGYNEISATWDGRRIDEFAEFLANIGIARGDPGTVSHTIPTPSPFRPKPVSGPIQAPSSTKPNHSNKDEMSAQQKHAEEVKQQKRRDEEAKKRILRQIEDDKEERRLRQERERVNRFHAEQAALERKARAETDLTGKAPAMHFDIQQQLSDNGAAASGGYVSPWQSTADDADIYDYDDFDDDDDGDDESHPNMETPHPSRQ